MYVKKQFNIRSVLMGSAPRLLICDNQIGLPPARCVNDFKITLQLLNRELLLFEWCADLPLFGRREPEAQRWAPTCSTRRQVIY